MKPFELRLLILSAFLCIAFSLKAHVALDYPQGSETFIQGQTVVITWHTLIPHNTINWDLYFSTNSGDTWEPLLLNISIDSISHTWVVPDISTTHGRIRVIQDNTEQDYLDFSMDFTIVPNTAPPSIDAPAVNITIPCNVALQQSILQVWLNNNGGASVSNNCGELSWTNDYPGLSNGCAATGNAIVTFTASDECGSTETFATVTVTDNTPPVILTLPSNITVQCDGNGNTTSYNQWINSHGGAIATDACGNVTWTYGPGNSNQVCGASGNVMFFFRATDDCGNSSSAAATFSIIDSYPPILINSARDTSLSCSASNPQSIQLWLSNHGGALAEDVCGNVTWTNNFNALTPGCGATGSTSVIFTATDDCGLITSSQATINVVDHSSPVIDIIARDTTMICGDPNLSSNIQQWLDQHAGAHATDLCGNVNWSNDYIASDSCTDSNIKITFTISDECGNSASISANLFTIDTTTTPVDQDTTRFAPVGATWYYSQSSGNSPWFADPLYGLFVSEKDTSMLGYHAQMISYFKNENGQLVRQPNLSRYVATVGQKIYYKVGDEFVLLYDFSAKVGDTIHSKADPIELSLGCSDLDSIVAFSYVIDSIASTYIDGEEVNAQYVTPLLNPDGQNWGFMDGSPILERIGYAGWGAFWFGGGIDGCILEAGFLRCYSDPDINWRSSFFDANVGCDYTSTTGSPSTDEVMIFPNPAYDRISLSAEATAISAYNLLGEKFELAPSGQEWLISTLSAGVYFLECKIENKRKVGRFVKMN